MGQRYKKNELKDTIIKFLNEYPNARETSVAIIIQDFLNKNPGIKKEHIKVAFYGYHKEKYKDVFDPMLQIYHLKIETKTKLRLMKEMLKEIEEKLNKEDEL